MITKIHLEKMIAASIMIAAAVLYAASPLKAAQGAGAAQAGSTSAQALDYEFFRTQVAPIFLKKRVGHGRCYACHAGNEASPRNYDYLEKMPPGASFWTEEQTQRIFQRVSRYVVPGNPDKSLLLLRPLAQEAGGGAPPGRSLHRGGRQFMTTDDPDWQTMAQWVRGAKADGSSAK